MNPKPNRTVHIIATQHLDVAWLWERVPLGEELMRQCLQRAVDIIESDSSSSFIFSRSTIWGFHVVERNAPELFRKVTRYVREGRIEVCGGEWVEPDHFIPDGESLVRQNLYGQLYAQERFGVIARVCWDPDIFAHCGTLPKILRGCGMDAFYSHRCRPRDEEGRPYHEFLWKADDGSEVVFLSGTWVGAPEHDALAPAAAEAARRGLATAHVVTGLRSDRRITMEPSWAPMPAAAAKGDPPVTAKWSSSAEVAAALWNESDRLPVVEGELGFQFSGTYTSHHGIKREHRRMEALVTAAERAATLAWLDGVRYPASQVTQAWRDLCVNEFHDIICGTCFNEAHDEAMELFAEIRRRATWILSASLGAGDAPPDCEEVNDPDRVVVFNPLSWRRDAIVTVPLAPGGASGSAAESDPVVLDEDGNELVTQVVRGTGGVTKLAVAARDLDGAGFTTWRVAGHGSDQGAAGGRAVPAVDPEDLVLENELVRVEVGSCGEITSCLDKRSGEELVKPGGAFNRLVFYREQELLPSAHGHGWEPWYIGLTDETVEPQVTVTRTEAGPVRDSITVTYDLTPADDLPPTRLVQSISLHRDSPMVTFEMSGEWSARRLMLKAEFDPAIDAEAVVCDAPYGVARRPLGVDDSLVLDSDSRAEDGTKRAAPEELDRPMQKWLDWSDGTRGIALLNDCLHGYDATWGRVRLSLLRAPLMRTHLDEIVGLGEVEMTYALLPHGGDWRQGEVTRHAYELNHPALASFPGSRQAPEGRISCEPSSVMITAIKRSEDDEALVLRLYEIASVATEATVELPRAVTSAVETDMLERPVRGGEPVLEGSTIRIRLEPYQIRTVRVVL